MKKGVLLAFFASLILGARGQVISYNLATIPDSIKKDAKVIVQAENKIFTIEDINDASLHVHKIYTVVNEDGKDELDFYITTTKFKSLTDAELKVYDANGKQISKHKKKEMITQAMGEGLVDDGYVTFYSVTTSNYPVTIDLEYELKFKGTLFYPSFDILTPGTGVVQSSFTARVPAGLDLRYKARNIKLAPAIKEDGKIRSYTWAVNSLAPFEYEESAVSYENRYPSILLAPNKFKMDDYEGDMTSWKSFGMWYASLKKGIDVLPEDKKVFFRDMVSSAKNDKEKIRIIYEYLQKNFRYVSIQLGIGGFKPFPATFTESKKYGDCKGLSNFMQAALDGVGIKSYQALINRQSNGLPVDPDFPHNRFNHVILLVPLKEDSVWLECTSSSLDFGSLDISTENKNALLITENGGVLVSTPASNSHSNIFSVYSKVMLKEDGSGDMETIFHTAGEYREMIDDILKAKRDEQKQSLVMELSFKQPDDFELSKKEGGSTHTALLKMSIEKVPEFSAGSKLFLAPRLYKIWGRKLPKTENRRLDFYFNFPFEKTDTTIYVLPAGYKVDALPPAKEFKTENASYISKCWYDETQKSVYSTVQVMLKQHVIPAAKYGEIKKFFDDVLINDGQKIVVKKE
jgi:hypothetical protein